MAALVSIVMSAYNAERFIAEAVDSVRRQSHAHWELLVVDDSSSDGTAQIIRSYGALDPRIFLFECTKNAGPAHARNVAIAAARGRYIAFLDSDDIWLPTKLERQISAMNESGAVLSFTAYKKVDAEGKIGHAIIHVPPTVSYRGLLKTNSIGCLTAVYDAEALGKLYMPEDLRRGDRPLWLQILKLQMHHEDYAFWLNILRIVEKRTDGGRIDSVIGIDEVLAYYRVHPNSVSKNKLRAAAMQWAVYRKTERLSVSQSLYYFLHYAYNGYKKANLK